MTIRVTQEHIDHGQRASCVDCPIALAVRECVRPELQAEVRVLFSSVRIGNETIELPPSARAFIAQFDTPLNAREQAFPFRPILRSLTFAPFEFELPDYVGAGGVWR